MTFLISTVTLLIVTYATVWALCRIAAKPTPKPDRDKILLNALNKTLDDYHAKRGTFAEGRPTMPSEVSPNWKWNGGRDDVSSNG